MNMIPMPPAFRFLAKALWDRDRAYMRVHCPDWDMPAWSMAPAWRKRPYYLMAENYSGL